MAGSHSTPPLQHAPIQPHHAGAGLLSSKMPPPLFNTLPIPPRRRSPSPMSPSGMGSFVTKAKAMLRGRRSSVQITESDGFTSGKPAAHRSLSHYQTYSARPPFQRQTTAPLPSTTPKSPRRRLQKKTAGSYSISNPISSNIEANYKYCELIDTADMVARSSRFLSPGESIVRSPSPSLYSDADVPTKPGASSQSVHQPLAIERSHSRRTTHDTTIAKGSRPKSDVFPLSVTASTLRSKSGCSTGDGRALASSYGYESHSRESLPDSHAPFEFDYPTPDESHKLTRSSTIHGLGLGISETVMAIRNAGMLCLDDDAVQKLDRVLGEMFSDAVDGDQQVESNVLAWLGLEATSSTHSADILDDYLDFSDDTHSFSMRAAHRPTGITRCLDSMTAGGAEFLLTDWRAQLDATCNFVLHPVGARRNVDVVANEVRAPEQSAVLSVEPLRNTKPAIPRSRSKTMPSGRALPRPSVLITPSLWEPASAPATPSLASSFCVASGSRTPAAESGKRRRNTRDMFFESQVSHVMKGSRSVRRPAPCRIEIIEVDAEEENSAEWIAVSPVPSRFPRSPGRRKLYPSPPKNNRRDQAGAGITKSHSAKSGMSKSSSSRSGIGMAKSPSGRSGMIKSPSARSGLSRPKSGPKRRAKRVSPSQSRTGVQASSHSKSRLPASSSTRSLPGGSKNEPTSPPLRSRVRPGKSERRQDLGKENMPAEVQRSEDLSMLRVHPTNCASTPQCPRKEADVMCTTAKALVAEMTNGRRPAAPVVPPRSPARPRTYSRI